MMGDAWVTDDPTVCPICGCDSCDNPEHLPPPGPAATQTQHARPRLTVIPALELMHAPRPVEIIEGFAWEGGPPCW